MLDTLENEKEYAKNILEAVDSALVALNQLNQGPDFFFVSQIIQM